MRYDGVNAPQNEQLLDTNFNIAAFGVDQNQELYICCFDGRIRRFKAIASEVTALPAPETIALAQNYPNPFNPATTISYKLSQPDMVSLEIYNLQGQLVNRLVHAMQAAGEHVATWRGVNEAGMAQPSGVYFYRLQVGESFVETKRMAFVK